jgi:polyhydroxyalkanoate synthesis regulator protein
MITIYRYSNFRRLYIKKKGFINYNYIYSLVWNNIPFQVLDHKTNIDLTYPVKISMLKEHLLTNKHKLSDDKIRELLQATD